MRKPSVNQQLSDNIGVKAKLIDNSIAVPLPTPTSCLRAP